jgi:mono/diheme cytochrome c family protein
LQAHDDRVRRAAAASQDAFWARRHEAARAWTKQHPAPPVPSGDGHPIDAFLSAKIAQARAEAAQTPEDVARQFHAQVLPVLRENCFRCHGEKEKGGLRLNSRAAALRGGDSEVPAVVPGDPEASELLRRIRAEDPTERMPPTGAGLSAEQIATLETWVKSGALWPAPPLDPQEVKVPPVVDDAAFLRRVFLDTVGVPASEEDVRAFLADRSPDKRQRMIDRLLADDRWADHWMGYWQDVLAENPTIVNASLNTTGPFRWFLYDALRDGKPLDRLVTELVMLRGDAYEGGSAGFGLAGDNDAPFAAKGQIVAGAFLGVELQCARCHDSPYHSTKQRDLYALAAMFERKPVTVPKSSRVPDAFFEKRGRESLIKVTLKPGEPIAPVWPFSEVTGNPDDPALDPLMHDPRDPRERLAALLTAPRNTRFAQVIVNRVWRTYLGAGLVEPPHDWEGHAPSHPDLLDWLAHEFASHDYDLKHLARLILTSEVYQREAIGRNREADPDRRFFAAPERRRLSAEQIVDSLYAASGQPMDLEEITFDPDGRRPARNRLTLGVPYRAWMLANLANERDRPSLNIPKARAVTDVLMAFGWSGARQNPRTDRETDPNVLQPGVLANSVASVWLTRAARGGDLAEAAVTATSPEALVDRLFLRYLGRVPTDAERAPLASALALNFDDRLVPASEISEPKPLEPLPRVTWSNHLRSEANSIALELEERARLGPPPDPRLRPAWREVFEDVVWGLVNDREFVWSP